MISTLLKFVQSAGAAPAGRRMPPGQQAAVEAVIKDCELLRCAGVPAVGGAGSVGGAVGAVGVDADNFGAGVLEEIAAEMLEDAARLREEGAPRAVKKRALVGWLEELVGLGLSSHASAVPAARKALDSLLEGAVDVERVLPLSFQLPMRMPGSKKKMVSSRQVPQLGAGDYFMRNVALLGRLRAALVTSRNTDLSGGEVSKCTAMCEYAVYLTALQRERNAAFGIELERLHRLAAVAARLVVSPPIADKNKGKAKPAPAAGVAGIPPQREARRTLAATEGLLRDAALRLQQLQALHAGACAAAKAEYAAAGANGSLLTRLAARLDQVQAALAPHDTLDTAGLDRSFEAARAAADEGEAGGAEDAEETSASVASGAQRDGGQREEGQGGERRWSLVSWEALDAAKAALAQVKALCDEASDASAKRSPPPGDAVSCGIDAWLHHVAGSLRAVHHPPAGAVKEEELSVAQVEAVTSDLSAALGDACKQALDLTQSMRNALVADAEAAAAAAVLAVEEPEAEEEEGQETEAWGMHVVERHNHVEGLLSWEGLQALAARLAHAQHLLACLSEVRGEAAQAQVCAATEELCRIGALVGMLACAGEEAAARALRFHR